jgi:hypothetical protein
MIPLQFLFLVLAVRAELLEEPPESRGMVWYHEMDQFM